MSSWRVSAMGLMNIGRGEGGRFIPDFILWLKHSKSKRTLVRLIEPHGLHHESETKARNKAQCLVHLAELSKQKAFKKKSMEMDGWILSPTEKLEDIPWRASAVGKI